jgi:hypothetical protein
MWPLSGQVRGTGVLTGTLLLLGACGTNPPPPPTGPLSVEGVYACALSVMFAAGWEVNREYRGTNQESWSASLRWSSEDPQYHIASAHVYVGRTDRGEIQFQVSVGPYTIAARAEQLKQRIASRCLS